MLGRPHRRSHRDADEVRDGTGSPAPGGITLVLDPRHAAGRRGLRADRRARRHPHHRAARPPACSTACRRCGSCCPASIEYPGHASASPSAFPRRADRGPPAVRLARRHARRGAALLRPRRRQALHRPDGALQVQPPAPAPLRRSGLAHRDQVVAESDDARRQHRGRRRAGRLLHAGRSTPISSPTRAIASSRSSPRSTCPATPTRRWRRTRS